MNQVSKSKAGGAAAKSSGVRMPAEWERHEATWMGWPHHRRDWAGKFATIPWAFAEMIRKITPGETVHLHVNDAAHEASARRTLLRAGADTGRVAFLRGRTNRSWTRDFGPIFVDTKSGLAALEYRFNAWALYEDWKQDDAASTRVAKFLGLRQIPVRLGGRDIVLEGGAIDVNGHGTLLATEECLLQQEVQVRNPGLSRADMNRVFAQFFGAPNVIWLAGGVAGDDTHGHVDDVCRFVSPDTVVLCAEPDPSDVNYQVLAENRERLASARLENGRKLHVVELPMPAPLFYGHLRLPASYANFYIANAAVLVPTFNDPNDRVALGLLSELIPDRPVLGVHAVDLVRGFGTIHCLTQQQPAAG